MSKLTSTFNSIFPTEDDFINGIPDKYKKYMLDSEGNMIVPLDILYLLLQSKYGENIVASSDDMFKARVYAIIFQYGPSWAKKLDIQDQLRKLSLDEITTGTKQINDHAYNPSTAIEDGPNPDSGEIETTNEQTKTRYVKSKVTGYSDLWLIITNGDTEKFLNKFRTLFKISYFKSMCPCDESEEN